MANHTPRRHKKEKPHGNTKFGPEDAARFRKMIREGMTYEEIRTKEGIGRTTLNAVLERH